MLCLITYTIENKIAIMQSKFYVVLDHYNFNTVYLLLQISSTFEFYELQAVNVVSLKIYRNILLSH